MDHVYAQFIDNMTGDETTIFLTDFLAGLALWQLSAFSVPAPVSSA